MKLVLLSMVGALLLSGSVAQTSLTERASFQPTNTSARQLADEITRRLRRMGFTVIKSQTARPIEMVGELC